MRSNLPQHYLSEGHQRILLLYILQLASNIIEGNQKQIDFDIHVEGKRIDLPSKVTTAASTTLVTDEDSAEQEHIKETINILTGGIETLNDDIQQLSNESLQQSQLIETTEQNLAVLKLSCEESHASLNALNINMTLLQQDCSSFKQKVEERQLVSYDGTFIWKITNVEEKMSNTF